MNREILEKCGVNYSSGMARFLNDEELYSAVLKSFANDSALDRAKAAFSSGDIKALLSVVHEVKGSSGNADLTNLYKESCALVTLLRRESYTTEELTSAYKSFETAYTVLKNGIRSAMEE